MQNPYWGSPLLTTEKVKKYYATSVMSPLPVLGSLEGVKELKQIGFKLIIVTARHESERPATQKWLEQHFGGEPNTKFNGLC